jgi:hypothetical protein
MGKKLHSSILHISLLLKLSSIGSNYREVSNQTTDKIIYKPQWPISHPSSQPIPK